MIFQICHFVAQSFPTPMEEPKKILRAHYLGCTQVASSTGMDTLNESIDRLVETIPQEQWQPVNISIAPSMISIHHPNVSIRLFESITFFFPLHTSAGTIYHDCTNSIDIRQHF